MTTIQNTAGSRGFQGYTTPDGNCVNPAYFAAFFDQMGAALQAAICSGRTEDRVFVLQQFAAMQGVVDTLVGQEGFTEQVSQLQQLIESLRDQDGDGVNDLQQIKNRLDALESSYNSQQQQINQHGDQITSIQVAQATQGQQISNLQDQLQGIDLQSLGLDVDAIRCEVLTDIYAAGQAGLNLFMQRLGIDCELPTSLDQVSSDGSGDQSNDDQPASIPGVGSDENDTPDVIGDTPDSNAIDLNVAAYSAKAGGFTTNGSASNNSENTRSQFDHALPSAGYYLITLSGLPVDVDATVRFASQNIGVVTTDSTGQSQFVLTTIDDGGLEVRYGTPGVAFTFNIAEQNLV